jgi:hypothetical protein
MPEIDESARAQNKIRESATLFFKKIIMPISLCNSEIKTTTHNFSHDLSLH